MAAWQAAGALHTLAGVLVLWLIFFFLRRSYRVSAFRQDLFNLRAELFDYVLCTKGIWFQSAAYQNLRRTLNSLIRFAHRITFMRFVWNVVAARWMWNAFAEAEREAYESEWKRVLDELPPNVQRDMQCFRRAIVGLVAMHVFRIPRRLVCRLGWTTEGVAQVRNLPVPAVPVLPTLKTMYRGQFIAAIYSLEQQAVKEREQELKMRHRPATV